MYLHILLYKHKQKKLIIIIQYLPIKGYRTEARHSQKSLENLNTSADAEHISHILICSHTC